MFIRQTKIASVVVFHLRTMLSWSSSSLLSSVATAINLVNDSRTSVYMHRYIPPPSPTPTPPHSRSAYSATFQFHLLQCARVFSLSHSLVKYSRLKCFIRFGIFSSLPSLFFNMRFGFLLLWKRCFSYATLIVSLFLLATHRYIRVYVCMFS